MSAFTLPTTIHYSLPLANCQALAARFELDQVVSLSGDFQLISEKDYFILKGSYKGEVILNGKNVMVEEPISLALLTSQTQEVLFDLTEDFEILDGNHTFDLEEVLGQYLYLEVCDFE
ncbi:MAG: hypothetical protein AAB323_00760 [Pseudomonadota bacterium]